MVDFDFATMYPKSTLFEGLLANKSVNTMKVVPKEHIVRGEVKWVISVLHEGKRRRRFFSSFTEARGFDVLAWLLNSR